MVILGYTTLTLHTTGKSREPTLSTSIICSCDASWTAVSNAGQSLTYAEKITRFVFRLFLEIKMLKWSKKSSDKIAKLETPAVVLSWSVLAKKYR